MSHFAPYAVAAGRVFDGETVLADTAVIIDGDRIAAVEPRRALAPSMPVLSFSEDTWLAPGFIDVQVNGGGDVLFNDMPTAHGVNTIAAAHRRFGTTGLLPTLITDTTEKMGLALAAAREAAAVNPSILGIHFEGPFLSPDKPGVHRPALFRAPDARDLALITSWPEAAVLVTLAPERVPLDFIAALAAAGVRVALGHSMATYAETQAAMAAGLSGFTHLFNAMRPLGSREPGPIAAALESPDAFFGMIADGEHVAAPMLQLALRGTARPMLVTDAMPPVGGTSATFTLYGETMTVREGRCTRADGTLAGAAIDMARSVRNAARELRIPLEQALRFAATEPAAFLGLGEELGRLVPGYRADIVAFTTPTIRVIETWVAGQPSDPASIMAATQLRARG